MEYRTKKLEQKEKMSFVYSIPYSIFHIPSSTRRGFGMIEMIIGSAILSVSLLGISSFFEVTLKTNSATQISIKGDYLLEEGVEAVKLLRDAGYANNISALGTSTPHHLVWNGTSWATTTANVFIDGLFERSFTVTNVTRDVNDDIATGVNDPDTRLITVSVAWNAHGATTTRSIATYIMDIFNN